MTPRPTLRHKAGQVRRIHVRPGTAVGGQHADTEQPDWPPFELGPEPLDELVPFRSQWPVWIALPTITAP